MTDCLAHMHARAWPGATTPPNFRLCAESSSIAAPQNGIKVFAMRHGNRKIKLNKPADQRKALLRSLTTEVLRHGKIKTTKVRRTWRRAGSRAGRAGPPEAGGGGVRPDGSRRHLGPSGNSACRHLGTQRREPHLL